MDILVRRIEQLDDAQYAFLKKRLAAIDERQAQILELLLAKDAADIEAIRAKFAAERERLAAEVEEHKE